MALMLVGCETKNARVATTLNRSAIIEGNLPFNPLAWSVITSELNPVDHTMSLLFGNAVAIDHARTSGNGFYPPGSVLSLVTWQQQEDPRWFGANIPAQPRTVEFVIAPAAADTRAVFEYRRFEGLPMRETTIPAELIKGRVEWLLSRSAAVMP